MSLCYFRLNNVKKARRYENRYMRGITETDESLLKMGAIKLSKDLDFVKKGEN